MIFVIIVKKFIAGKLEQMNLNYIVFSVPDYFLLFYHYDEH